MAERIVVAFVAQLGAIDDASLRARHARFAEVRKRAEAHGGVLCSFGPHHVAFDFAVEDFEEAVLLATAREGSEPNPAWGVGIAQGEMEPLGEASSLVVPSFGAPLVKAMAIARAARLGETLIDPEMPAAQQGEVLTVGARSAKDGSRRVRGLVIDPRQVFRRDAAEKNLSHIARPALFGRHAALGDLVLPRRGIAVLRAEPGVGGTRMLEEVALALHPARSLHLVTAGAEPLGSLRYALSRAVASVTTRPVLSESLERVLAALLAGEGATLDSAAELVSAWLGKDDERAGAALIDDAMEIDDPSLEVVARAKRAVPAARVVVRLGEDAPLPACFAGLGTTGEVAIGPLAKASAEAMAGSILGGRLSAEAARRWAKRGRFVPLGIGEAIAEGLTTGDLAWSSDVAAPRNRTAGPQLDAADWIDRRLRFLSASSRAALEAAAVLGVVVATGLFEALLARVDKPASGRLPELVQGGWLQLSPEFVVLPSRTHREAVLAAIDDRAKAAWHDAASVVVEAWGGRLAKAEAARHAILAGNQSRAIDLALDAARASSSLGLEAATEALLAFAGATKSDITPAPQQEPAVSLDGWIEALRATGEREDVAERLEAIAALARGETSRALSTLRSGLDAAKGAPPAARSRAALAYGIALAAAGRRNEALLSALEALARARECGERRGEIACSRFLSRLAMAAGHSEAAKRWLSVAAERRP